MLHTYFSNIGKTFLVVFRVPLPDVFLAMTKICLFWEFQLEALMYCFSIKFTLLLSCVYFGIPVYTIYKKDIAVIRFPEHCPGLGKYN